jgi:hypothetical protein
MKKTTGIIFLLAAALGAFVYFYDLKHTKPGDADTDSSVSTDANAKPAFTFLPSDAASITVIRGGATVSFEKRQEGFYMTEPLATQADQSTVGAVASELSSERVLRTLAATPEQLTTFGLTSPAVTLQVTLKNGTKHTLKLGNKDFSGINVYAIVDGAKDVSIMSDAILTSSDKPVDEFRDQSVLHFQTSDATAFELMNDSGEIAASKSGPAWKMDKPRAAAADGPAVSSFLDALANARVASFVDDASKDLSKYGLTHPAVSLRIDLAGGKSSELRVGKKDANAYFATVVSQPFVFRVDEAFYKSLDRKFFDLRDKRLLRVNDDDAVRLDIRDGAITGVCVKDSSGEWTAEKSADAKSKSTNCPSMWGSLRDARAQEIYDAPSGTIGAQLAKPVVEVTLTDKSGKKTEVRISGASGDSVYARTSESPEILKLDKQILRDLNPASTSVHD